MRFSKIDIKIHVLGLALFILTAIPMMANALPAFPGAMGWGSDTVGGRGGTVIKVTNLNDSGPGSLRAALDASGPRIIIFTVGGTINLVNSINIYNPFFTVAGQTAPGGGILIRGPNIKGDNGRSSIIVETHDVIIRGLRIRDTGKAALEVVGNRDNPSGPGYNVIIDHNSFSWADDTIAGTAMDVNRVTFSYNIISEGTDPLDGSAGMLLSSAQGCEKRAWDITLHHNLFAHTRARNPLIKHDVGRNEFINNVVYNWDWRGIETFASTYISRNVFAAGPSTTGNYSDTGITVRNAGECPLLQPGTVMVSHNIGPNRPTDTGDDWLATDDPNSIYRTNSPPFTLSGMTEDDVSTVKAKVLANAGATAPYRDAVDVRVLADVANGTGTAPPVGWTPTWPTMASGSYPTDTDGDGMPDAWETAHGLNPNNSADAKQYAPSGYQWIEEYINSFFPAIGSPLPPPSALIPNPPTIIGVN